MTIGKAKIIKPKKPKAVPRPSPESIERSAFDFATKRGWRANIIADTKSHKTYVHRKPIVIRSKASHPTSNRAWHCIAGNDYYFKSTWEYNYALYLQWEKENNLILDWLYEPQRFLFSEIQSGCRIYVPDFQVIKLDSSHYWVEVKGYMDAKSKTKIKRFGKYYPEEELRIVDKTWFANQRIRFPKACDNWSDV